MAVSILHVWTQNLHNMEEEKRNAGKFLSEILENDENSLKILLNQWQLVDKKLLFKFILWGLR